MISTRMPLSFSEALSSSTRHSTVGVNKAVVGTYLLQLACPFVCRNAATVLQTHRHQMVEYLNSLLEQSRQ